MRACCTPNSLVAVSEGGFLLGPPRYYTLDGLRLTSSQLSEIQRREKATQLGQPSEEELSAQQPTEMGPIQEPAPAITIPMDWERRLTKLRSWFRVYLALLIAYWALAIAWFRGQAETMKGLVGLTGLGALISYIVATVHAYKLQKRLDTLALCKPAAGKVLAGVCAVFAALLAVAHGVELGSLGIILVLLSPLGLGLYVPLSVLRSARRIKQQLAALAAGEKFGAPDHSRWQKNAENLRVFFGFGALAWCVYLFSLIGYGVTESPDFLEILRVGFILLYISWFPVVVYAYKIQRDLHRYGLYKHGAWHVVVAGLLLSPLIGLYVGFSSLRLARRIKRQLDAQAELMVDVTPPEGAQDTDDHPTENVNSQPDHLV